MASYAFIQQDDDAVEVKRLCATDATSPLRIQDGSTKAPAAIVVGDRIKTSGFVLRVDSIVTV